jgi:hypothetical protein
MSNNPALGFHRLTYKIIIGCSDKILNKEV